MQVVLLSEIQNESLAIVRINVLLLSQKKFWCFCQNIIVCFVAVFIIISRINSCWCFMNNQVLLWLWVLLPSLSVCTVHDIWCLSYCQNIINLLLLWNILFIFMAQTIKNDSKFAYFEEKFETSIRRFDLLLQVVITHWWLPVSGSSHRPPPMHDQDM